jgi:hypothetical protein
VRRRRVNSKGLDEITDADLDTPAKSMPENNLWWWRMKLFQGGLDRSVAGKTMSSSTWELASAPSAKGIGFDIPANMAKGVMKQIIEHGRVVRGWLGIELQDRTADLAEALDLDSTHGVLISAEVGTGNRLQK